MENTKNIEFSAQDAEYIAEALNEAIEEADNIGTDNEVYNRAPRMRNILNRIIDRYELPDPWSDRPDTEARRKVAEKSPGFDEYIKHNGTEAETDAEKFKQANRERLDAAKKKQEERRQAAQADIDAAWSHFRTWENGFKKCGAEILHVSGPDRECPYTVTRDGNGNIGFIVAYINPRDNAEEFPAVRAMVVWASPDTRRGATLEYEEDNPGILCPAEILGLLSPVPENSSAFMWRELSRRKLVQLSALPEYGY